MDRRITRVKRGRRVAVFFDGAPLEAYEGETLAAALVAAGIVAFRFTARTGSPRSLYCGMGVCYDCLIEVDGASNQRACMTVVNDGMRAVSQVGWSSKTEPTPPDA